MLNFEIPMDYFIDSYVQFLEKGQSNQSISVPPLFNGQEFDICISKLVILKCFNYCVIAQEIIIKGTTESLQLPTFLQQFDNIFENGQNILSETVDQVVQQQQVQIASSQSSYVRSSLHQPSYDLIANAIQLQPASPDVFNFLPNIPLSLPINDGQADHQQQLSSLQIKQYRLSDQQNYAQISTLQQNYVQLSPNSITLGSQISGLQNHVEIDIEQLKMKDIHGYIRYHMPSYNIAIIAFSDPFHRQDLWNHSLAIWYLPNDFRNLRIQRDQKQKNVFLSNEGEQIYIARAFVLCDVHPLQANSGIYIVDKATLISYQDPCDKFKEHHMDNVDATVEGSVYWQEIPKAEQHRKQYNSTSYGFVRLASGHERHFYLKESKPVLGHLVKLKLFSSNSFDHPNSCELLTSLLPPPDKHKWLYGRIVKIYSDLDQSTEQQLKQSFRINVTNVQKDCQIVNGMILSEPMQGTHVDLCFFRLMLPKTIIQQLKPGLGIYFTLKELALHKVVDQTDSLYQTPVELVNKVLQYVSGKQSVQEMYNKQYVQNITDVGNSKKLSCWAIDNISLSLDQFAGTYKNIVQRKCSGLVPEQSFYEKYGSMLLNGKESLVYVPRPTLNIFPPIFKEQESYSFNVHFVYSEAKFGFMPESNQIKKIKLDVSSRKIQGRIVQLHQIERCPIYIFQPTDSQFSLDDVSKVFQCLQDSLTPETNCYVIQPTAFYLVSNEIFNRLISKNISISIMKEIFSKLINGKINLYLKKVSLALISDGEFERHESVAQAMQLLHNNIYTTKDEQGNKRNLYWCRCAEEICLQDDVIVDQKSANSPDIKDNSEVDFLSY